jgi:hypothetical protein
MSRDDSGFGLEPIVDKTLQEIQEGVAVHDPFRRAMRYIGDYVKMDRFSDSAADKLGKIVAANENEILLMPYVSILPIPGKDPVVQLVEEGKPLSVSARTINDIELVTREYVDAFVPAYKEQFAMGGQNGRS